MNFCSASGRSPAKYPTPQQSLLYSSDLELGETTNRIFEAMDRIKPARVVLDSLSEIRLLAQSSLRYRRQILALKHYFAQRDVTVLLLDDMTAEVLDKTVHSVAHGATRLEVLDFAMPGMNGVELARQVQQKRPTVPILFVTGYVDKAALEDFGDDKIISKPFIGDELAEKINAAVSKRFSRSTGKVILPLRRW